MFVNSWRLWAPNLTSHRSLSLFFLFFSFFPFLSTFLSFSLLLFAFFRFSILSFLFFSHQPLTRQPTPTQAERSSASIFDHTPKSSTTLSFSSSLLSSASTAFFRSGRSVKIGIHSNDLAEASKSASTATIQSGSSFFDLEALLAALGIAPLAARSSIWKLCCRR